MRIKVLVFAITLSASSAFATDHPLKMSFSNLVINPDGSVEIETRIFLDDLTEHMQKIYSLEQADFSTVTSNGSQALARYLTKNFYFEQGYTTQPKCFLVFKCVLILLLLLLFKCALSVLIASSAIINE